MGRSDYVGIAWKGEIDQDRVRAERKMPGPESTAQRRKRLRAITNRSRRGRTEIGGSMESIADFLEQRQQIHSRLSTGRVHVLAIMRDPAPAVASEPIGDLLCWCDGLDERIVMHVLTAAGVNWGRQTRLVSALDQKRILWQIKAHRPLVWAGRLKEQKQPELVAGQLELIEEAV